jgi:hypothetical protein
VIAFLKAFGLFWYDFLVGDSIVLAVGGVLIVALGYVLVQMDAAAVAQIVLPLAGVLTIYISLPELRRR